MAVSDAVDKTVTGTTTLSGMAVAVSWAGSRSISLRRDELNHNAAVSKTIICPLGGADTVLATGVAVRTAGSSTMLTGVAGALTVIGMPVAVALPVFIAPR